MTKACVLQPSIWLNSISFVWRGVGYFAPGVFVSSHQRPRSTRHRLLEPVSGRSWALVGRYKNPWCKPAKQRFILIFGYMLEITLWKYVSITHFRDSIWLKYDQIRWCDSFQNPEFHWKALESWIKPQNIWVRSLTDPSRKRASGSDVFLPSADVKYLKNVCVNGSNLIDSSTSTKSGP